VTELHGGFGLDLIDVVTVAETADRDRIFPLGIIDGTVENSVIFRGVKVEKGAVIKNSIVMQDVTVKEGASLNYVIIDKDVQVHENRMLMGFETYPIYISKGSVV
jgi:glucose-1-phosphate adenylyltransferase